MSRTDQSVYWFLTDSLGLTFGQCLTCLCSSSGRT
jgi:hypothetical protein